MFKTATPVTVATPASSALCTVYLTLIGIAKTHKTYKLDDGVNQ